MIDLYPLIPAVNAHIFNPAAELVILPTGIPTNEANVDVETATDSRNKNKKML